MMTLSSLETLCWSWLDDLNGTYFTKAQLDVWINNAQREVQKQLVQAGNNWYVTRVTTSTIANQDTYALPSDFTKLNKFELVLQGVPPNEVRQTLCYTTDVQIDRISMTTGTPSYYAIRANSVIMRPIPNIVYTMYMDYTYLVADMVTPSQVPDCPTQFQEYIAVLATLDGLFKDQRDPSAMMQKKEYYMNLMKQDAQQRSVDGAREVIVLEDQGFGYLF